MELSHDLQCKKETLRSLLERFERVAVAFSAGVDSTFLLAAAYEVLGDRVLAVTGRTISTPKRDLHDAAAFCESLGVRHRIVDVDQMAINGFADNPPDRCYHCKKELFSLFLKTAEAEGFPILVEGTNADDAPDDRPGMRALRELHIKSPLRDAKLTKQDIRMLSNSIGLQTWDKPSFACLATRIPFGETITPQKLARIEQAEALLFEKGFRQVRVRSHGNLARIEVETPDLTRITEPDLRREIAEKFTALGFDYVTLDLNGFRSGSMNKTIQ